MNGWHQRDVEPLFGTDRTKEPVVFTRKLGRWERVKLRLGFWLRTVWWRIRP